jgi:hypothetical protein
MRQVEEPSCSLRHTTWRTGELKKRSVGCETLAEFTGFGMKKRLVSPEFSAAVV